MMRNYVKLSLRNPAFGRNGTEQPTVLFCGLFHKFHEFLAAYFMKENVRKTL